VHANIFGRGGFATPKASPTPIDGGQNIGRALKVGLSFNRNNAIVLGFSGLS
jgi:hypothetical protein